MIEDTLAELMEQAVPPVPKGLCAAPIAGIRQRARRRRARLLVGTGLAVATVVTAVTMAVVPSSNSAVRPPAATPTPEASPLSWQFGRVARDDRNLVVVLGPAPAGCMETTNATARYTEEPDRVLVAVSGDYALAGDCSTAWVAATLPLRLPAPLGDRVLVDAATGRRVPVYHDRDLPDALAEGWTEVTSSYSVDAEGTFWCSYTRDGGPDLQITAAPIDPSVPYVWSGEEVRLGSRTGKLVERVNVWTVRWQVNDLGYSMDISTYESNVLTREEALATLSRLDWP